MPFKSAIAELIESNLKAQSTCAHPQSHDATMVNKLRHAIRQARAWQELSGILKRTQAAFEHDKVSLEEAEGMAILATKQAQNLSEADDSGTAEIRVEAPVNNSVITADLCPCCGQANWWDKSGQPICRVCHPEPTARNERNE